MKSRRTIVSVIGVAVLLAVATAIWWRLQLSAQSAAVLAAGVPVRPDVSDYVPEFAARLTRCEQRIAAGDNAVGALGELSRLYHANGFLADAIQGYRFKDGFHVNLGSLILTAKVFFLGGYTFSCHSLRHLIGGRNDELSNKPLQCAAYNACSALNKRHMFFAWASLIVVGFSDIYVRMLSMGKWTDIRFF